MSLSETMTALMDKAREITGLTEKISIARLTSLMNHFDLHVNPNIFPETEFTVKKGGEWSYDTPHPYINLKPGTYTFSWKAKTDGSNKTVRIRIIDLVANTYANFIVGPFAGKEFPLTSLTQSYTFTIPKDEHNYNLCMYGSAAGEDVNNDVTFYDCKLEAGDLATPLNSLGGIVPPNLFDIARIKLTNANRDGTLFTFEDNSNLNSSVYTDFLVQNNIPLKKNTAYQLSFSVRGTGTIVTYVYGNNSSGKYIDNGHRWGLTNQWQDFQQYLPPESVPLNANFNFRSATNCSGEVTNLKLTPVE